MAKVNLTEDLWKGVEAKLRALFKDRLAELDKQHVPLTEAAYESQVPKDVQLLLTKVPAKYLNIGSEFIISLSYVNSNFKFKLPAERLVHDRMNAWSAVPISKESAPVLWVKLVTLWDQRQALKLEEQELVTEIKALWDKCTTLKQLVDVWPTALDFVVVPEIKSDVIRHQQSIDQAQRKELAAARKFEERQKKIDAREETKAAKAALKAIGPVVMDSDTKVKLIKARMLSNV